MKTIEGKLDARGLRVVIVASRFNDFFVDRLIGGAVDYLVRHGCNADDISLVRAPGAFELPLICKRVAAKKNCDGIVALGVVMRGSTPHFDFVANESVKGLAQVGLEFGLPIGFGLLTTDTLEQTIERSGSKAGNKGAEAAAAMLETVRVLEALND